MGMQAIVDLAQESGGMVTTTQVGEAGIPRARISDMVKAGKLDEFLAAQLRFFKGVLSDGTVLFLHGYTDRTPLQLTITFPCSCRATKAREAGIEVRTCADGVLDLGRTSVRTSYGNEVRAYDLKRTLCDVVCGQRIVDVQVVSPAMRQYARSGSKDVQRLLGYAHALEVKKKI